MIFFQYGHVRNIAVKCHFLTAFPVIFVQFRAFMTSRAESTFSGEWTDGQYLKLEFPYFSFV